MTEQLSTALAACGIKKTRDSFTRFIFITLHSNLLYAPTQNYQRTADLIVKAEWYV